MAKLVSGVVAAENALVAWISSQLTDIMISKEWPTPGEPINPNGSVSILRAGGCDETPVIYPNPTKVVPIPYTNNAQFYWRTHACEQPMQMDVWATSELRRDDIVERLNNALTAGRAQTLSPAFFATFGVDPNQNPVEQCIVLQLAAPWDHLVGAYQFESPETEDSAGSNKRREYRATYRGSAFFDRTVIRVSPRLLKTTVPFTPTH